MDTVMDQRRVVGLRVVVRGVSPLIWRRLTVAESMSLVVFHEVLQVVFGWSGERLHEFRVHGRTFDRLSGGDAGAALTRLELRPRERFEYRYDFFDGWVIDVRVEQIRAAVAGEVVPRCVAGRRAGPPEGCGGPVGFMAWEDSYSIVDAADRLTRIVDGEPAGVVFPAEQRAGWRAWLARDRLDRRGVNRDLARLCDRVGVTR